MKGAYPVTGSGRATLWVEKSADAVYNLLRFPVYAMPSLPAWIRSLKTTCSVHCHTAIQHHSNTNISDKSVLGSGKYGYGSYMWIITAFFSC